MPYISHHWPGIHPGNVWDMPLDMWLNYLDAARQLRENKVGWWSDPPPQS